MDYRIVLTIVEEKLGNSFPYIADDIKDLIASGSTGGEIMSMIGKYLKDLQEKNETAYDLIKEDILKYLEHCRKNGHTIL